VITTTATRRVDTVPAALSPGGVLVVGFQDPERMPGGRVLATARVRCDCRGITATNIRNSVGVTVGYSDPELAEARVVLQAVPIS
jgi:hypothetical protein